MSVRFNPAERQFEWFLVLALRKMLGSLLEGDPQEVSDIPAILP